MAFSCLTFGNLEWSWTVNLTGQFCLKVCTYDRNTCITTLWQVLLWLSKQIKNKWHSLWGLIKLFDIIKVLRNWVICRLNPCQPILYWFPVQFVAISVFSVIYKILSHSTNQEIPDNCTQCTNFFPFFLSFQWNSSGLQ